MGWFSSRHWSLRAGVAAVVGASLVAPSALAADPAAGRSYDSPSAGAIAGGSAIAVAGVAGLVGGALLLRGKAKPSRSRAGIGAGIAVLGGILVPLGLSLVAIGTQKTPTGDSVPQDDSQMIAGGLLATAGGIALGGGVVAAARDPSPVPWGGLGLLGAGNVLIAVGMPLWVHGSHRVAVDTGSSGAALSRGPF